MGEADGRLTGTVVRYCDAFDKLDYVKAECARRGLEARQLRRPQRLTFRHPIVPLGRQEHGGQRFARPAAGGPERDRDVRPPGDAALPDWIMPGSGGGRPHMTRHAQRHHSKTYGLTTESACVIDPKARTSQVALNGPTPRPHFTMAPLESPLRRGFASGFLP